jgi:hypothetical protein
MNSQQHPQESHIRPLMTGLIKEEIQHLGSIISSINIFKNAMLMPLKSFCNALMKQLMQETARFACGFWRDVSVKISAEENIVK